MQNEDRRSEELKRRLTPEQYHITQEAGTERSFTGEYYAHDAKGDYHCETLRGRSTEAFARRSVQRTGGVKNYPRLAIHVWHLVARSLASMGYAGKELQVQEGDMEDAA